MNNTIESMIKSNPDVFKQSDFVTDFLRLLGWKIIMILRGVAKSVESLFDAVYDFLNITNSDLFQNFYDQYRPLIVVGLIISILALGSIYMLTEKRPEVLKNFIIGLMVVFATPTFIQYLNEAIFASKAYLVSDLSMTDSVISANITDLLYLDKIGWDFKEGIGNSLDENSINHLDASEHVNRKNDVSPLGREIFNTRILVLPDGKITTGTMGAKGWGDIFDPPYYYRYSIHFFQIPILLIIFIFVIVFASYKTFILIYEIMNSRIIGSLVAMDLTSGQKVKKVIEGFFSAYFSLFYILVSLKLYAITQAYINAQSYGPIVRTLMLLFAGFLVMDGPNLVEKIFGYDVGLGSSAQKFMSLMRLGMEGMQLKYYAQNMGMGNLGKTLSNLGSALNNKFSFNNSKKPNAPEPPSNPNAGEAPAYSSPEPNATPNSQNYHSASNTDNKPKDMPNNSDNNELNPNSEGLTAGNDQTLNGENGTSYSTAEPPVSGSELNENNTNSSELSNDSSGLGDSSTENTPDIPLSTSDSSELNNESSIQESGQQEEYDTQKYGYDSEKSVSDGNKEPTSFSDNSAHQVSPTNAVGNIENMSSNTNNNPSNNIAGEQTPNSSLHEESSQSSNNYTQDNASNMNGNESNTETEQFSQPESPNAHTDHNRGVDATRNKISDMGTTGATNSTGKGDNLDKQQNSTIDSKKERLMDKKFGTESVSPHIISSLPKEEPNFNPSNPNTAPTDTKNDTPISNNDNNRKYNENIAGTEHSGKLGQEQFGDSAAYQTDSTMSKSAFPTTGAESQVNNVDTPIDQIGNNLSTSDGTYTPNSSVQGNSNLSNETLQSSTPLPHESSYDGLTSSGYISSESGLKLNDSLLDSNSETTTTKSENTRNLNVADVLNTPNPELPKGSNEVKTNHSGKKEKTDKKNNGTRSKSVSNKKKE